MDLCRGSDGAAEGGTAAGEVESGSPLARELARVAEEHATHATSLERQLEEERRESGRLRAQGEELRAELGRLKALCASHSVARLVARLHTRARALGLRWRPRRHVRALSPVTESP